MLACITIPEEIFKIFKNYLFIISALLIGSYVCTCMYIWFRDICLYVCSRVHGLHICSYTYIPFRIILILAYKLGFIMASSFICAMIFACINFPPYCPMSPFPLHQLPFLPQVSLSHCFSVTCMPLTSLFFTFLKITSPF